MPSPTTEYGVNCEDVIARSKGNPERNSWNSTGGEKTQSVYERVS
jgi:hypothetical protein